IPLNRWRLLSRRFNQAALLATALGRETGWPVAVDALRRIKRTRTQVGLTANQRRSNVSGAFRVQPRYQAEIRDRNILLVDDVLTTGATIDAAARTLRRAGARRVNVVTVARVVAPVVPTA
ncbi:MAG: phosphoribosyltransferase family protein, partial [Pseudomonadota bacterium]